MNQIITLGSTDRAIAAAREKVGAIGAEVAPVFTSQVTGSVAGDALVGGILGYALSPREDKLAATAIGAAATGLAGVLGLLGTTGYLAWINRGRLK